jgi:hypothetical protein
MVVGSPLPEPSWSPAGGPAETAEPDRHGSAPGAPSERPLDLALVQAAIRDGLLMVFGPEGDPVPPQVFGAAAAGRPDAEVRLVDGPPVRAERIAAVLDAQVSGRLGPGRGADEPWISAMLGIGPQLQMAATDDSSAEACTLDMVVLGKELMITSRDGATFLIADARARTADSICVWVGSEGPIAPGALADRLLGGAGQDQIGRNPSEFAMPGCKAWLEDDALLLDLPEIGPVYLAHIADAGATAPAASLFTASGEVATIGDLLTALSAPVPPATAPGQQAERVPASPEQQAESLPAAPEQAERVAAAREPVESLQPAIEALDQLPPASTQGNADGPTTQAVPLAIALPDALAAAPDRVVLLVVRGLPEGASLSAGVASGDGSWLLSPADLPGLSLTPPRERAADLSIEITAIAVASAEGELTASTVRVPWRSAAGSAGPSLSGEPAPSLAPSFAGEPASSFVGDPASCSGESAPSSGEPAPDSMVEPAPSASAAAASSLWDQPAPPVAVGSESLLWDQPAPPVAVGAASSPWHEPARMSVPLNLDQQSLGEGGSFDAYIVRDVPAGVSLSAGTYDPAMAVWVVLPHQLSGLSVLTSGGWTEDFSLSVLGLSLRAGAGARPRLLAQVPVRIGH